jgi:hypothetical protein
MALPFSQMKKFNRYEIWFAKFPYEDDANTLDEHPVIVLNYVGEIYVMSLMVTGSNERSEYDIVIKDWEQAGLSKKSVIRTRRRYKLEESDFRRKIGELSPRDQILLNFRMTE